MSERKAFNFLRSYAEALSNLGAKSQLKRSIPNHFDMELIAENWYVPLLVIAGTAACSVFNKWKNPATLKNELATPAVHFKGNTAWSLFE